MIENLLLQFQWGGTPSPGFEGFGQVCFAWVRHCVVVGAPYVIFISVVLACFALLLSFTKVLSRPNV